MSCHLKTLIDLTQTIIRESRKLFTLQFYEEEIIILVFIVNLEILELKYKLQESDLSDPPELLIKVEAIEYAKFYMILTRK